MSSGGVRIDFTGDAKGAQKAYEKLHKENIKLRQGMAKVSQASRLAGQQLKKGFGSGAKADLMGYAKGLGGVVAGIGLITSAFRKAEEAKNQALGKLRAYEVPLASLAQLADTPEEMRRLVAAAKQTYAEGTGGTLGEAASLVFSLESAGALSERKLFSDLATAGIVADPAKLAKAAKTLLVSMGEEETGGLRDIVSKGFGASKFAPSKVEELLEAAARSGPTAGALKMRDEEVLAGTAIMATATGEATRGATGLNAMLKAFDKQGGFRGLGLAGSIEKVQAMGMTEPEKVKFFGRSEGIQAFRILSSDMQKLGSTVESIVEAQRQDKVGAKLRLPAEVPAVVASQAIQQAKAVEELGIEHLGVLRSHSDVMLSEGRTAMRKMGVPEPLVGIETTYQKARRLAMGDKVFVAEQQSWFQRMLSKILPAVGPAAGWIPGGGKAAAGGDAAATDMGMVEENTKETVSMTQLLLDESKEQTLVLKDIDLGVRGSRAAADANIRQAMEPR